MCEHNNVIDGSTYKWRLTPEYSFGVGDDSKTMAHAFTYVIPNTIPPKGNYSESP